LQRDQRIEVAFESFGITLVLVLAGAIAFGATCATIGCALSGLNRSGEGIFVALVAGVVAASFAVIRLGRSLWPRKD
jgi:hypothetical protein